jgi:hypothetical protein
MCLNNAQRGPNRDVMTQFPHLLAAEICKT